MIIRKLFKFEGAHIAHNCTSQRCRENIHGHSYRVEVFITSNQLDNGYMIMDFGRLGQVKELIDSFDHAYSLWQKEKEELKQFIYTHNQRVVEMPIPPSSEGFALLFFEAIDRILQSTPPTNGEGNIQLHSVRVHETETGYAEAFREDKALIQFQLNELHFSPGIQVDWKDKMWWEKIINS